MSIDTCARCGAAVDTDFDMECYDVEGDALDCTCERCREKRDAPDDRFVDPPVDELSLFDRCEAQAMNHG